MPELFRAGFETGDFSEFVSGPPNVIERSGVAAVVSINPAFGTYHMQARTLGVETYERASARHNVGNIAAIDVYARAYVTFLSAPDMTWALSLDDSGEKICAAGIDGTGLWRLRVFDGTTYFHGVSTQVAQLGRTYCVELHVFRDPVNGFVELFVDGQLVTSVTGVNMQIGTGWLHVFAGCTTGGVASETYVDEVVVADEYIGPQLPQVSLSYESSPVAVDATINNIIVPSGTTVNVNIGTVTLAVPGVSNGYSFNHWNIDGVEHTENPVQIEVAANMAAVAYFSEIPPPPPRDQKALVVTGAGIGVGFGVGYSLGGGLGGVAGAVIGGGLAYLSYNFASPLLTTSCAKCRVIFKVSTPNELTWCPRCGAEQVVRKIKTENS